MELFLHQCDISNPLKPVEISYNWGIRCVSEFMLQGDLEKKLSLPIIKELFDRETVNFHNSQVGFIENIVMPLYKQLVVI